MTRITKKDIEGMVVRLTRSIAAFFPRGLVEIRYDRNPVYGVCNLDLKVNYNEQRITIKSSKKSDIYHQIHFACELFEFYGQIKDQKTPREQKLQEVKELEQEAKDRLIETLEWVNVLEQLDMDEREELMKLYEEIGQHPNMIQTYRERLGLKQK